MASVSSILVSTLYERSFTMKHEFKSQCRQKSDIIIKIADTAKKSISLILSILIDPYTK